MKLSQSSLVLLGLAAAAVYAQDTTVNVTPIDTVSSAVATVVSPVAPSTTNNPRIQTTVITDVNTFVPVITTTNVITSVTSLPRSLTTVTTVSPVTIVSSVTIVSTINTLNPSGTAAGASGAASASPSAAGAPGAVNYAPAGFGIAAILGVIAAL